MIWYPSLCGWSKGGKHCFTYGGRTQRRYADITIQSFVLASSKRQHFWLQPLLVVPLFKCVTTGAAEAKTCEGSEPFVPSSRLDKPDAFCYHSAPYPEAEYMQQAHITRAEAQRSGHCMIRPRAFTFVPAVVMPPFTRPLLVFVRIHENIWNPSSPFAATLA